MAAASVLILSSPPPRPPFATRRPSSPILSLAKEAPRKQNLDAADWQAWDTLGHRGGEKGVDRPSGASKRSASLLHESSNGLQPSAQRRETASTHRAMVEEPAPAPAAKRRKSTPKDPTKAKVTRPRAKKAEDQSTLKKGKIIKPLQSVGKAGISSREETSTTDFYSIDDFFRDSPQSEAAQAYTIEKALRRRTSWTPPNDTIDPGAGTAVDDGSATRSIRDLCGAFGYNKTPGSSKSKSVRTTNAGVMGKRKRRIEVVQTAVPVTDKTPVPKKSKARAPKKKATTITGQATAQYAPEAALAPTTPLLDYLQPPPSTLLDPDAEASQPNCKRATSTRHPIRKSNKRDPATSGSLLAPDKALRKMEDQGFLFGTSSQLAAETSPNMIRQVQEAIRISEQATELSPTRGSTSPGSLRSGASFAVPKRTLWSAAARGIDGSLIEHEKRGPSPKSSEPSEHGMTVATGQDEGIGQETAPAHPCTADTSWHHIDDDLPEPELSVTMNAQSRDLPSKQTTSTAMKIAEASVTTKGSDKPAKPKGPKRKQDKADKAESDQSMSRRKQSSGQALPLQRPVFDGYPTAQLSKELTAYGFKASKNRKQMIALVEKCWESKHKDAIANSVQSATGSNNDGDLALKQPVLPSSSESQGPEAIDAVRTTPQVPPKPARGRPRKDPPKDVTKSPTKPKPTTPKRKPSKPSTTTTPRKILDTAVEEISDSDTPPTPSPPRRRSPNSTPLPLQLSTPPQTATDKNQDASLGAEDANTPNDPTGPARRSRLFQKITRAIRLQPRAQQSAANPTWHEKILLYDAIVLEDLAAWLNTEGLGRVGVDEEVAPAEVKAWCEEHSVCCLWRENLRGGTRGRY